MGCRFVGHHSATIDRSSSGRRWSGVSRQPLFQLLHENLALLLHRMAAQSRGLLQVAWRLDRGTGNPPVQWGFATSYTSETHSQDGTLQWLHVYSHGCTSWPSQSRAAHRVD